MKKSNIKPNLCTCMPCPVHGGDSVSAETGGDFRTTSTVFVDVLVMELWSETVVADIAITGLHAERGEVLVSVVGRAPALPRELFRVDAQDEATITGDRSRIGARAIVEKGDRVVVQYRALSQSSEPWATLDGLRIEAWRVPDGGVVFRTGDKRP